MPDTSRYSDYVKIRKDEPEKLTRNDNAKQSQNAPAQITLIHKTIRPQLHDVHHQICSQERVQNLIPAVARKIILRNRFFK